MGNGVNILADDGNSPDRSGALNVGHGTWGNMNISGAAVEPYQATPSDAGGTTVDSATFWAKMQDMGILSGPVTRAALLDITEPEDDVPLDEARRIARHRHRHIEGLLGD